MKTARAEAVDAAGRTVAHQILSAQCRSMPRRFPRVEAPERGDLRLHLDLAAGADQGDVVDRLLGLGAQPRPVVGGPGEGRGHGDAGVLLGEGHDVLPVEQLRILT